MKYPKLSFLFISKLSLMIIFVIGFYWLQKEITNTYRLEVKKNLELEIGKSSLSEVDKLKLEIESTKKLNEFGDKLYYLFLFFFIVSSLSVFLKDKTDEENSRLDNIEENEKKLSR